MNAQCSGTVQIGQTLGFALAKGLVRGLTCCKPAVEILVYYLFLDVCGGVHTVSICQQTAVFDLAHIGVMGIGGSLRTGVRPYS